MVEQDLTPSKVTQSHLQSLMNQGYMTAMELTAYHVHEDPAFPIPAEGCVVAFVAFYERGFSVTLVVVALGPGAAQSDPSGVLHITTFMTLCEAFMGIDFILTCGTISSTSGVARHGHGTDNLEGRGYSCQAWAWRRSIF
jgi:hypothetical protein